MVVSRNCLPCVYGQRPRCPGSNSGPWMAPAHPKEGEFPCWDQNTLEMGIQREKPPVQQAPICRGSCRN